MGNSVIRFFVLLSLLCAAVAGMGAVHAEGRVAYVDIPYLIDKAPQALDAEKRLESEFGPRQEDLQEQRAELSEKELRLANDGATMSEDERGQLDREVRGLERRLKRDEQDFREELNIQKNNEFKKVRILVLEAIARFGESNNYDLIVSDGVLYANESIHVTEKILADLVKQSKTIHSSN